MTLRSFLMSNYGERIDMAFINKLIAFIARLNGEPINLEEVPSAVHGDYVFRAIDFAKYSSELRELHELHWEETEVHAHGLEPNVDHDLGIHLTNCGRLITFGAFHGDELIGNCIMRLGKSTHTQLLMANEDTLFLRKDHRGYGLAMAFLKYVLERLRGLEVTEVHASTKLVNKADKFFIRAGFQPVGTELVMMLE